MAPSGRPRPLLGLTVGVTAERRAQEQIELLERHGARVQHAPAVQMRTLEVDDGLRAATEQLAARPPDVLVLNTGVGVRSWLDTADSLDLGEELRRSVSGARVLARGPKALGAAATAGWSVHWNAPESTTKQVVAHLAQLGIRGARVAVQLDGRPDQPILDAVRDLGAEAIAVPVYRCEVPADTEPLLRLVAAIRDGHLDAVTFTSAPAVHHVREVAEATGVLEQIRERFCDDVVAVCVGPVCEAAAHEAGFSRTCRPARARLGPMVRAFAAQVEQPPSPRRRRRIGAVGRRRGRRRRAGRPPRAA